MRTLIRLLVLYVTGVGWMVLVGTTAAIVLVGIAWVLHQMFT